MPAPSSRGGRKAGQPPSIPEGTPAFGAFDHSFTLQAVMDLQKTVAALGEKVERSCADTRSIESKIDGINDKMDKLKHWQTIVTGGALVVAAIAGLVWTIVTFVPWDRIKIEPPKQEQVKKP